MVSREAAVAAQLQPAPEKRFYENNGVIVTNARFIVPAQTYAMSGITSVKFHSYQPSRAFPTLLILVGLLMVFGGFGSNNAGVGGIGLMIGVVGAIAFYGTKMQYSVVLATASGETKALSSTNADYIRGVVGALNDAIIFRQ